MGMLSGSVGLRSKEFVQEDARSIVGTKPSKLSEKPVKLSWHNRGESRQEITLCMVCDMSLVCAELL